MVQEAWKVPSPHHQTPGPRSHPQHRASLCGGSAAPNDGDACGGGRGADACGFAAAMQGIMQWLLAEPAHKLSRARLSEFLPEVCNGEVGACFIFNLFFSSSMK